MGFGTIFKADAIVPDGQRNFWTEYILRFSRMKAKEREKRGEFRTLKRRRAGDGLFR